jgi:hypothetical protein
MTQQVNLFGETINVPNPKPVRGLSPIQQMHKLHGQRVGFYCQNCQHLRRTGNNRTYFKCGKFVITSGSGTDWRAGYVACGLYDESRG